LAIFISFYPTLEFAIKETFKSAIVKSYGTTVNHPNFTPFKTA
jgi:hypothetical protein